ncbi:hypothetical protein GXP70_13180 [Paenibacillus lycopersici]|uniref:Uncharacterized protein n=1 Tax=Paenibacillus lycopersici TaxID=2704462 RepID=A0A6C0FVQ4_9BACL|nr:hypothetical protein [Paenibacillus lycopersici]QHT60807.1 hypothetical protein GXP70_13180 [Paenibacillus lycopersici]
MHQGRAIVLELLRICVVAALWLYLAAAVERHLFQKLELSGEAAVTRASGNLMLFYVLYRNWLQFRGWYTSSLNRKLGKRVTALLVVLGLAAIAASAAL